MRVIIYSDGEKHSIDVAILPVSILQIKQEISRRSGIPVEHQNLFEYPDVPDQGPGLRLYTDNINFPYMTKIREQVSFVLTLGKVSSWVHFYVLFPSADGQRAEKYALHKFETVASLKGQIQDREGLQANSFVVSHDMRGIWPLADLNRRVFSSGIENGILLYCVFNAPKLTQ